MIGLLALMATAKLASAQPTRVPPTGGAPVAPVVLGPQHRYFGTLASATGSTLVIRLRNGRNLGVDASQAFALKRVSEPLFAGKPTVVQGTLDASGVLHASAVRRAAPSPIAWGNDQ